MLKTHKMYTAVINRHNDASFFASLLNDRVNFEYAELFDEEVGCVLDSHSPLQTRRRRRGQHDIRHLSDDARKAKQARRRLERQYRRTGCESDRRAYQQATRAAASRDLEPITSRKSWTL